MANPQHWTIWNHPRRLIIFIFVTETGALTLLSLSLVSSGVPEARGWINFLILSAGSIIHIQFTRRQEERRRNRIIAVHIDLTAVWIFPAALVLPVPLILLLVLLVRILRWFTARRPLHKFLFSSISIAFAAVASHQVSNWLDPSLWEHTTGAGSLQTFGVVVVAGLIYSLAQTALTGGFLALGGTSSPTVRNVLGSKADNVLEAVTVALGAVTAVLLVNVPPTVGIMAIVTVLFNRLAELDQLQADARTDSKTGLLNMRGWTESAQRAFLRASRSQAGLAILMIDFDHFKRINDTFGHPAGDDVLRRVAEILTHVTRPTDTVGRFGGEEFLILIPGIDTTGAKRTAERIRGTIRDSSISTIDKRGGQVTITDRTTSIGVAVYPDHGNTVEELLHAADAAVYAAKEHGRDQVRFARSQPSIREAPTTSTSSRFTK